MGYLTDHTLSTRPIDARQRALDAIVSVVGYDPFEESCKWYRSAVDLEKASLIVPDVIIVVTGHGEQSGDEWVMYALDGAVDRHERGPWTPPPIPDEMLDRRQENERAVQRAHREDLEKTERRMLAELKAKYEEP